MHWEAITRGRALQMDFDEFYVPRLDDQTLADWLEDHDTLVNYSRNERLNPKKWKEARATALDRDNNHCIWPSEWHSKRNSVHHVVPLYAGGDPYALGNLATLCDPHCHVQFHPGMAEAYENFRNGDKDAFHKFSRETHRTRSYIPPREADILKGMVMERTSNYLVAKRSARIKLT